MNTRKVIMRLGLLMILVTVVVIVSCKDIANDINPQQDSQQQSTIFDTGSAIATVQPTDIDEASGLAHSRSNVDYVWTHNDSGGEAMLYLLTMNGADAGRYKLDGIANIDMEDMALGAGPDDTKNYLYLGDIGDNRAARQSLSIYRFEEPDLTQPNLPANATINNFETINFIYEDGARDAETLMVDPATKDILIVSKREPSVILYKLPFPQNTAGLDTAERVGVLPYTFITAGDISVDGSEVLIKNYLNVYYWKKEDDESIAELLSKPGIRLNYQREPQGEAVAFRSNGTAYLTLSELGNASEVQLINYNRN